jgi:hypothetical protein
VRSCAPPLARTRIGCIRAREAHKARTLHSITRRGPDSERIRAFLLSRAGRQPAHLASHAGRTAFELALADCSLTSCRGHACTTGCGARSHQADIAQQAERGHAMAEAPGSMPGIRSRHLIAGVFRHNGRACVPRRAGTAGMCGAGTPALAQREHISGAPRSRWSTTAMRSKPM